MIEVSSPTRVDFSGGTLDCWPLFLLVPDAITVNLAIDIQTTVKLEPRSDSTCEIHLSNPDATHRFADTTELLKAEDARLTLVREVVRVFQPRNGFNLRIASQSPIGAGLGGSSSLTISLIRAFKVVHDEYPRERDVHAILELAHNIEARVLGTPTGTQDYVPAYLGGLNALHYKAEGLCIEMLPDSAADCAKNLMLIYTGRPHHSGLNNWQVIKAAIDGDKTTLRSLREISDLSQQIYSEVSKGRFAQLPELFNLESEARIRLSAGFTSPEIDRLKAECLELGGQALKICGAGGGGCVLIWAEPSRHAIIEGACEKRGFKRLPLKPVGRREKNPSALIKAY